MDKHKETKLDLHIKNTLMDGEATPPELVWDNISKTLYPEKKKTTFWWAFLALLFALIFTVLLIALSRKNSPLPAASVQNKVDNEHNAGAKNLVPINAPTTTSATQTQTQSQAAAPQNTSYIKAVNKRLVVPQNPAAIAKQLNFNTNTTKELALNKQVVREKDEIKAEHPPKSTSTETQNNNDFIKADSNLEENTAPNKQKVGKKISVFALAGWSYFNQAVYNTKLSTGVLNSNQKSENKGFQYSIRAAYELNKKQSISIGFNYNHKYSYLANRLHVTPNDFLNYHNKKQLVPIGDISQVNCNEYFYINDFVFEYEVQNYLLQMGYTQNVLSSKKWSYDVSLTCYSNLSSSVRILTNNTLSGIKNEKEQFSFLGIGLGNSLNYKIGNKVTIGIAPQINGQLFNSKKSVFAKQGFEIIVPIQLGYHF
jgi:hypothetical protein